MKSANLAIRRAAVGLAVAAGAVACSGKAPEVVDSGSAADNAMDTVECSGDASPYPVDTYRQNLTRVGRNGLLTFTILGSNPAPPEVGVNTFAATVTHADGSAFQGSLVIPFQQGFWMPLHNHGPSDLPVVTFDAANGDFVLQPMDFFMPGLWRLTLQGFESPDAGAPNASDADPDGAGPIAPAGPTDVAVFYFCL